MSIGTKITQLRKERKMSQEDLAHAMQISRQAVSKWENGQANPDTENLIHLAEIFQVDVNVLVGSQTASAENQTVPKASKLEKAFSRTIWVLTALVISCVCTTSLFAGLWLTERSERKTQPTESPLEDSPWREVHMYKGLMKEEVSLTDSEKLELMEYIFGFHFVEESETHNADSSEGPLYGGRMYEIAYYMEDVYFYRSFYETGFSCIIQFPDGTRTKYSYEVDWLMLYELDRYAR